MYRALEHDPNNCDYILITGQMRGCPVTNCNRYEKGNRISMRKPLIIPTMKGSVMYHEE